MKGSQPSRNHSSHHVNATFVNDNSLRIGCSQITDTPSATLLRRLASRPGYERISEMNEQMVENKAVADAYSRDPKRYRP